jgi:hypothetical protein
MGDASDEVGMNSGVGLALGAVGVMAAAGALSRRGSASGGSNKKFKSKTFFSNAIEAQREADLARASVISNPKFQKWFAGSEVVDARGGPLVVYHGTSAEPFDVFKPEGPYRGGLLAFFATKAQFSEGYGSYIYPVYLACRNVFDFREEGKARSLVREFYRAFGGVRDDYEARRILMSLSKAHPQIEIQDISDERYSRYDLTPDMFLEEVLAGSWPALECDDFVEFLREEKGYDGILLLEHGSVNYGVFDPDQIKSATGNSGDFSVADARISYNRVSR